MAICAWEIVWGVVSINGKTVPVPKPESMELATMNWLSSLCADASYYSRKDRGERNEHHTNCQKHIILSSLQ